MHVLPRCRGWRSGLLDSASRPPRRSTPHLAQLPTWWTRIPGPPWASASGCASNESGNRSGDSSRSSESASPDTRCKSGWGPLVGLPTWLWIDPATWRRISAAARVPGVTTTATAAPLSVVWAVGDGSTVTCRGAGTVYTAATPPWAASPDCGYVFRSPSPPEGFRMTATVHWSVSWQGAGRAGVFPDLVSTTAVTVHVLRVPAVNVLPGGGQ